MRTAVAIFCLLISAAAFSQAAFLPVIKQGSKLHYQVSTAEGTNPIVVTLDSITSQFMKWGWATDDGNHGTWIMKKNSLESANQGWWGNLEPDSRIELTDNQSVGMFSKAQWNAIQKDKTVTYDMVSYTVKSPSEQQRFKLGEKEVNAIFLEGANGTSKVWLLNNPALPIILRLDGNTVGPDILLKSVD